MSSAALNPFKLIKNHWRAIIWIALGLVALHYLLPTKILKSLDPIYERKILSTLYTPSEGNSNIVNVYLKSDTTAQTKVKVIENVQLQTSKPVYILTSAKDLADCSSFKKIHSNVTFVIRDKTLSTGCIDYFKKNNINHYGFLSLEKVSDYLNSEPFITAEDFGVDLGKGEYYRIKSLNQKFIKDFKFDDKTSEAKVNFALSFSQIPQVNGFSNEDLGKKVKDKVVFLNLNEPLSLERPYTIKSDVISDDFYLSTWFYSLSENTFVGKLSGDHHLSVILFLYFQIFVFVCLFGQLTSLALLALTSVQLATIPILGAFYFNSNVDFSDMVLTVVFSVIHFQILKRFSLEKLLGLSRKQSAKLARDHDALSDHFMQKRSMPKQKELYGLHEIDEDLERPSLFKKSISEDQEKIEFKISAPVESKADQDEYAQPDDEDFDLEEDGLPHLNLSNDDDFKLEEELPFIAENFEKVFKLNRSKHFVGFKVVNPSLFTDSVIEVKQNKKNEMFFEAISLQIIGDCVSMTDIEFSSHKIDSYIVYVVKHKTKGNFDYKKWLLKSTYFMKLSHDLKSQGVVLYQNREEPGVSELAIAFRNVESNLKEEAS